MSELMLRPMLFVIAMATSACAMAGLANDNNSPDGSQSPPADGNGDQGSGSDHGSGSDMGSGSGSGSNMQSGTCSQPFSGTVATWDLSSENGSETSAPGTGATGATAGSISRSSELVADTGAGSINSTGFTTSGSVSTNSFYYTFKLTPPTGCTVSLTGASIDSKASAQGPGKAAVATSADQFGQITQISATAVNTPTLSVSNASGTLEVRIYGYDATSTSGTLRIENTLTLTGSFQ
jgi:hypothetical protein